MNRATTIIMTQLDDYNFATRQKLQTRYFGELPRKKRTGTDLINYKQIILCF